MLNSKTPSTPVEGVASESYAVVGNPIQHSLSPLIHTLFAQQFNKSIRYERIESPLDRFAATVQALQHENIRGINVTVPFKQEAFKLANKLTDRAREAKAVNTLYFQDSEILGDNTDGQGLMTDLLQNHQFSLHNKKILILGAGGAVQGIVGPLLRAQPASLSIANRSEEKAIALAKEFNALGCISGCAWESLSSVRKVDLIIHATSAHLHQAEFALPESLFESKPFCYDMAYGPKTSPFLSLAQQYECPNADGLGMLVEQAAAAFSLWHGLTPQVAPVFAILKSKLVSPNN